MKLNLQIDHYWWFHQQFIHDIFDILLVLIGFNILNRQIRRVCIVSWFSWKFFCVDNYAISQFYHAVKHQETIMNQGLCVWPETDIFTTETRKCWRVTDILFIQFFINLYLSGSATFLLISLPRIDQLILIYASRKCCAVSICRNVFHH